MNMEEKTIESETKEKYQILLDIVRHNYASAVWTHKIQEKQAEIYHKQYAALESINIIAAAFTSCGIITTIFVDSLIAKIASAVLAFLTLSITAYYKSFDLKNMEQKHKESANKIIVIRNELMEIIAEIQLQEKPIKDIEIDYLNIMNRLKNLYVDAPSTTTRAVKKATKALNVNNEYTYNEEEIDHFLPPALRGRIK